MSGDRYSVFEGAARVLSGLSRVEAIDARGLGQVVAREVEGAPPLPTLSASGTVVAPPASGSSPSNEGPKQEAGSKAPARRKASSPRRGRAAKENPAT